MRGCRIMRANVLAADEPKPNYLVLPASGGWRGWAYKSENSVGGDVDCYRGEQEVKYWGYCMHVHSINLAKILAISMFPFLHAPSSPSALSTRPCLLELCAQRCCSIFFILVSTSKPYLIPPSHCLLHPSPHYPCHHHFFSSYPYSRWPPSWNPFLFQCPALSSPIQNPQPAHPLPTPSLVPPLPLSLHISHPSFFPSLLASHLLFMFYPPLPAPSLPLPPTLNPRLPTYHSPPPISHQPLPSQTSHHPKSYSPAPHPVR
jgi:hypothetical protein